MIISFDIASKSLSVAILKFNNDWNTQLTQINTKFHEDIKNKSGVEIGQHALDAITKIEQVVDNIVQPIFLDVVDLIPGKKVKDVDVITRASRLRGYLHALDDKFNELSCSANKIDVLLEYQMGPNDQSRNVCSQILYQYSSLNNKFDSAMGVCKKTKETHVTFETCKYNIHIVGPSIKNKINLVKEKDLGYFMDKYATKYDANKNHSKANFKHWIKTKHAEQLVKNIKKKNIDDIADAVNMALAWLKINNYF